MFIEIKFAFYGAKVMVFLAGDEFDERKKKPNHHFYRNYISYLNLNILSLF